MNKKISLLEDNNYTSLESRHGGDEPRRRVPKSTSSSKIELCGAADELCALARLLGRLAAREQALVSADGGLACKGC